MLRNFNVDAIVDYLKPYRARLPQMYTWNFDFINLARHLDESELDELKVLDTFSQNTALKQMLSNRLKASFRTRDWKTFDSLCHWIIYNWGKIRAGNNQKTQLLLREFTVSDKLGFSQISSTSKVAEFMYPERHVIYDSRVAFAINWILLSRKATNRYFPIPDGRNTKIQAFDISVLIRLHHMARYQVNDPSELRGKFIAERDMKLFIPKSMAYETMRKLLQVVNHRLWNENDARSQYPFYTEMLLFAIADKQILKDMTDTINLNFEGKKSIVTP